MRVHLRDATGWHLPFVRRQVLDDRLMKRFSEADRIPLRWMSHGQLVSVPEADGPLLLLGADALGRDVFSRVVNGARLSLGVSLVGMIGALAIGAAIGVVAGTLGGRADSALMFVADFVLVLPAVYLVLVLRATLPPVLTTSVVFWMMGALFAVAAWPHVARGVRAIVAGERRCDYAEAARAAGAGSFRLMRHLLPAARRFLAIECVLLIPALLAAEATVSFLGLGFPEPTPSWGTMLTDAANVQVMRQAPWILAPAGCLFLVVLAVQLIGGDAAPAGTLLVSKRGFPQRGRVSFPQKWPFGGHTSVAKPWRCVPQRAISAEN